MEFNYSSESGTLSTTLKPYLGELKDLNRSLESSSLLYDINANLLRELNANEVKHFIPVFVILGLLMIFGVTGNILVLIFIWPRARKCITSFFILVLGIVDLSVCLTVSLAIYNYTVIYMFTNTAVCKIYVFSKFFTALLSGYILIIVAAYRYRKLCHPLKRQLGLKGARISVGCGVILVLIATVPQLFLIDTVEMKVPTKANVTVLGCDCVTKALDNRLNILQSLLDGSYLVLFFISIGSMIIFYYLQGRAILKMKKNRTQLMPYKQLKPRKSFSDHSDELCKSPDALLLSSPPLRKNHSCLSLNIREDLQKSSSQIVSMSKVTRMFFIISIGFILTFLPYMSYALWRTFRAKKSDILFTTAPVHLLCLNSYIINSVINPVIYAFFHVKFRKYLNRILCSWRTKKV